jgi:MinD-like ATPase involved in chromosome partitioning or flagellar assembly
MNIAVLRLARTIVLVIGDDPAALFLAPGALENIERMSLSGTVHLVLNHTRPHGVTLDEVMQATRRTVAANLPYEPAQVEAITRGIPLVVSRPDSMFARTVYQLARQI